MLMHSSTLYLSTILIWGSTWLAIKFQLGVVAEEVSLAYRFLLAAVILLGYCILTRRNLRFSMQQHVFMGLQGLFLFSCNYLVFYWATHLLTSGLVAVTFSTVIIMNMIGSRLFLKKKITFNVLFGATFGLVGIVMIFWPEISAFSWQGDSVRGLLMGLFGTALASIGNIISARNQSHGLPVIQTNTWGMAYGGMAMLLFALFSGVPFEFDNRFAYVGSLLYLSVFGSVLAFGAYLTLIGRIGADKTAYAAVAFPAVALALSTVFEGYQWTSVAAIGLFLVLLGNIAVLRKPAKA